MKSSKIASQYSSAELKQNILRFCRQYIEFFLKTLEYMIMQIELLHTMYKFSIISTCKENTKEHTLN